MKIYFASLVFLLVHLVSPASAQNDPRENVSWRENQSELRAHPYFNFDGEPLDLSTTIRDQEGEEGIFYFILSLVLFIALMRLIFYKYMSTMFTLFFRATLRQQQLRDQMLQSPLPSLLMNIFFVVSTGAYLAMIAGPGGLLPEGGFWQALGYAVILLTVVYLGKFIFLNAVGWIFGITNATSTYLFVVFLVNKMMGIILLPFVILLAFPYPHILPAILSISLLIVGGLLLYRYLIAYRPLRSEIKLSRFHFILYLCAFEIAPLLLIYKVLLAFVG